MPEARNCRRCGRIFNYIGSPICPLCKEQDEDDFKRIKDYLYDNPKASITLVSTDLDISMEKIKRFLKDGRLEIADEEGNMVLECENCGRSIKSGRYCPDCERTLASGFRNAASQFKTEIDSMNSAKNSQFGMRYMNKGYEKK